MSDLIEFPGFGDPSGVVLLRDGTDRRGFVRGFIQHGELAGEVDVDLSRMEEGHVAVRPRGRMAFVFNADEHAALREVLEKALEDVPDYTLRLLCRHLGERGADRLLEKLELLETEAGENEASNPGAAPSQQ